jgi:chromatin assembly factor 1 subunit B
MYKGEIPTFKHPVPISTGATASSQSTPTPTPTSQFAPPSPFHGAGHQHRNSTSSLTAPSPPSISSFVTGARPSSPARSNSTSSAAAQSPAPVMTNPSLIMGTVPSIAATNSGKVTGVPMTTPPETPRSGNTVAGQKRPGDASESEKEDAQEPKKRRVAPVPVAQTPDSTA